MIEKTTSPGGGVGVCPFSWTEVTMPPGCLGGLFGGQAKIVSEPQPCMMSGCQLWDSSHNNCGLITALLHGSGLWTDPPSPERTVTPLGSCRACRGGSLC